MDQPQQSLIAERGAQMFPTLSALDLARLKRFGTPMHFAAGAAMQTAGEAGHGLMLILSGEAEVTQRLPVRIAIQQREGRLRPGMMVEVYVDLR